MVLLFEQEQSVRIILKEAVYKPGERFKRSSSIN